MDIGPVLVKLPHLFIMCAIQFKNILTYLIFFFKHKLETKICCLQFSTHTHTFISHNFSLSLYYTVLATPCEYVRLGLCIALIKLWKTIFVHIQSDTFWFLANPTNNHCRNSRDKNLLKNIKRYVDFTGTTPPLLFLSTTLNIYI